MWQYHDSKLKELKKTYNKVSKQTQNRLQEIFDGFSITFDKLYNIADAKNKKKTGGSRRPGIVYINNAQKSAQPIVLVCAFFC